MSFRTLHGASSVLGMHDFITELRTVTVTKATDA